MKACLVSRPVLGIALAAMLFETPGSFGQAAANAYPAGQTIIQLQTARTSETTVLQDASGRHGSATLINLNPAVNSSFVLTLDWPARHEKLSYHIENPARATQHLALDAQAPGNLTIDSAGKTVQCPLWPGDALASARRSLLPYAPLCDGRLYLRNAVRGNRSSLEATTEFLRDHVWRGEQVIGFVRREFYQDAFIERASPAVTASVGAGIRVSPTGPPPALVIAAAAGRPILAPGFGIEVGTRGGLLPGQWYAPTGLDNVSISLAQPGAVAEGDTVAKGRGRKLDAVESDALAYLVAFDLAAFELGFALGTEQPRLAWSPRMREELRDARLPGPDGIANAAPLERTGMVSPALQPRVVATFTGGFKREHGAFRYGTLANVNHGSHYGFIEQGVIYSRLNPGLSTLYVLNDGSVGMKTWSRADDQLLGRIRHARQNGVALIERSPAGAGPVYGGLVDAWGPGNWAGSADEELRTLRAGACLIEDGSRRFLVYGYFSTATPRAMARVFQAYGCSYAMHLDMNALEHTYLALYRRDHEHIQVEHLVGGMAVLDKNIGTTLLPRFLGFPDDRDFFYLTTRKDRP